MEQVSISLLNDKYYKIYKHIFDRLYIEFHLINNEILFNYSKIDNPKVNDYCIYKYYDNKYYDLYNDIFFLEKASRKFEYEYITINKLIMNNKTLIITNSIGILKNYSNTKNKFDILLYYFKPNDKDVIDYYNIELKKKRKY